MLLFLSFCKNKVRIPYVIIFLLLTFVAGFRSIDVGVDSNQYSQIFNVVKLGIYYPTVEPGWNFINWLVGKAGGNVVALFTITAFLTLLPVFYVSRKLSPFAYFSVFIYYGLHLYSGSFNIMRQYMAVSLVFLAFYLLYEEKKKMALLVWVVACTIHVSCFLAIIFYLIKKTKLSFFSFVGFTLISLVIGSIVNERIIDFITFSEYSNLATSRSDVSIALFMTVLIDIYMFFIVYTAPQKLRDSFWGKLFILSVFVFNVTYTLYFSARIYSLFAISQIVFFPMWVKCCNLKNKYLCVCIVLLYVSIQFWRMLLVNANSIIPYELNQQGLKMGILNIL